MISQITRNIIIRALKIRKGSGEDPETIIQGYKNLTEEEKQEILEEVESKKINN